MEVRGMSRIPRGIVCGCTILLLVCSLAQAQVSTSRLEGMVQDATGAVVPGAQVSVVNNRTQARAEAAATAEGLFIFPSLQPGNYTLSVEAAGFRKAVVSNIELNVGATVSEIVRLEVGAVTESVVVEANAVRVQTTEAQISRAVTMRDIEVLPQLGRAPIILAVFQTGVQIDPGDTTFSRVNGLRQGSNNSKLDGIDVNDSVVPRMGLSLTANNTDSVGEFRVVSSGGKAEFGRSAGAQIELITRSGTNQWSGNAFDYLRNHVLHANNFFNNSAVPAISRPKFIQNMFGGSLGGPILKDRTFIFGNYQGRRTRQEIVRNRTVLTPDAKRGLFRWRAPGSTDIRSFDIVGNDPRRKGIDPKVADILKLLPDPNNYDVGDGLNSAGFRFNNPNNNFEDQFTIRADHNLSSRNRVFFRLSWQRNSFIDSLNGADARYPGQPHGTQGGRRWGYATGSDWTITNTMVNELRFGHQSARVAFNRVRLPQAMLLANTWADPLNPAFAQGRNSPVNDITDNLSIVRGKHTFKVGGSWRFTKQYGYNDAGIYPNVTFATTFGNVPPATIGPSGAAVISSADRQRFENLYNELLGRMNQVTQTFYSDLEKFQPAGAPRVRNTLLREGGNFFQDDWRVNAKLTLNLGLRWEFYAVPKEKDRLQGTLDKAALLNTVSQISDLTVQRSSQWYNNDRNNFAPRLGLAYDPWGDGRTAIRAGYGVFYDRLIGATVSLADGNTPGFSQAVPVYPNSVADSDVRVSDGIPLPQQPGAPVLRLPGTRSTSVVVFNPQLRTGYVQQYSLTIQRELLRNTRVEIGYVGTRGTKMFMDVDYNQPRVYQDFLGAFRELQAFRASGAAPSAANTLVRIFGTPAAAVSSLG
ncbi:MAG: TonB-dependent receptor, partial [Acidobacteria bacterium]|nr:TonB-dependent receptor [Acidobacteriota bacterium]